MLNMNNETFLACEAEFDEAQVVLYGAPFDSTTSFRPGSRFGSGAIRHESYGLESYSPYQDKDLTDYAVMDSGDIELPMGDSAAALDAITRGKLQQMLMTLWEENHKTILFVTHDIEEALLLSDEVLVLSHRPGQVLEHLTVELPRPRRSDIMFTSEFLRLRSHLSDMLTREVT